MSSALAMALLVIIGAALFVWWVLILFDALRTPKSQWEAAGQSQLVYIVLMALLSVIGTIAYVVVARPQLRRAVSSATS